MEVRQFSGDPSAYATYFFPKGFNSEPGSGEKTAEQRRGTLIIANTVSGRDADDLLKKAQDRGALNVDLYQDLPSRILSTLRFMK